MNRKDAKGRGGQPAKLVLRTNAAWLIDAQNAEKEKETIAEELTREAMGKCDAPEIVFSRAFNIMLTYHRQMEIFENPRASADKNKANIDGVGRYKKVLQRRLEKMAKQIEDDLENETSHDLNSLTPEADLRGHMISASNSLMAALVSMARTSEGFLPKQSQAEIRSQAGGQLKALARQEGLPMMRFVEAFGLYPKVGNGFHENEAFTQWYQRLKG